MSDNWIDNLKIGDNVVFDWGYAQNTIKTVEGFTKTSVRVNGYLFLKKGGFLRGGGMYNNAMIRELTHARLERMAQVERVEECRAIKFNKLSAHQLDRIIAISKEQPHE